MLECRGPEGALARDTVRIFVAPAGLLLWAMASGSTTLFPQTLSSPMVLHKVSCAWAWASI